MEKNRRSIVKDYISVAKYAGEKDFVVEQPESGFLQKGMESIELRAAEPSDVQITEILRQMGKPRPEDELNCGSCGYDTCRAKARAIFQGKAESSMCLPFLKDRAESFSDSIVNNTPNGIVVLNDKLEVQSINNSARKIMNIRSASDVLGEQVIRILEPKIFISVLENKRTIRDQRVYYA